MLHMQITEYNSKIHVLNSAPQLFHHRCQYEKNTTQKVRTHRPVKNRLKHRKNPKETSEMKIKLDQVQTRVKYK